MADPHLPGTYRAMVILQGSSSLPEDRFITTWCFRSLGAFAIAAVQARITALLTDFWLTPVGAGSSVDAYIGPQASRAAGASKIVTYDLGEATPRTPHTATFTLGPPLGGTGGVGFPAEVACCLSLRTAHLGPRGLGRVYIGPLAVGAAFAGAFNESRPTPAFRTALGAAAARMRTDAGTTAVPMEWGVLSGADGIEYEVLGGWVDDAWDTQRRRGLVATGRTLWP